MLVMIMLSVDATEIDTTIYYPEVKESNEDSCFMWKSMYEKQKECLMKLAVAKYKYENEPKTVVNTSSPNVVNLKMELNQLKKIYIKKKTEYKSKITQIKKSIQIITGDIRTFESKLKRVHFDIDKVRNNNLQFKEYLKQSKNQNNNLTSFLRILIDEKTRLTSSCGKSKEKDVVIGRGYTNSD